MAAVTICSDFGAPKTKFVTVSTVSPSISHEGMGPDAIIFIFWISSFKPTFSLSSFTEAQAGIAGRNISNLIYADDTTFMAESEEEEPLDESERGEWKSWLKTPHSEN